MWTVPKQKYMLFCDVTWPKHCFANNNKFSWKRFINGHDGWYEKNLATDLVNWLLRQDVGGKVTANRSALDRLNETKSIARNSII